MPHGVANVAGIESAGKNQRTGQAMRNQRPVETLAATTVAIDESIEKYCLSRSNRTDGTR